MKVLSIRAFRRFEAAVNRVTITQVLLVSMGGFVGSGARFLVGEAVHRVAPTGVPLGTLVVNVAGCLAIGMLGGLMETRQVLGPGHRLFLMVGVLGGFTTFSTFALETFHLASAGGLARAAANATAHVVLGLGAAWLGWAAMRAWA